MQVAPIANGAPSLLGSSIVTRLGANRLEPVRVTVGATVLSDTLSLVVFAVWVSTFKSGFSISGLAVQMTEIAVFVPLVLFVRVSPAPVRLNRIRAKTQCSS